MYNGVTAKTGFVLNDYKSIPSYFHVRGTRVAADKIIGYPLVVETPFFLKDDSNEIKCGATDKLFKCYYYGKDDFTYNPYNTNGFLIIDMTASTALIVDVKVPVTTVAANFPNSASNA